MTLREDEPGVNKAKGLLVLNVMRKIAMALFKQDETKKVSMAAKRKIPGLDDKYRSTLIEFVV